jgi:hypothetical protein
MKKIITTFLMITMMAITMPLMATTASAATAATAVVESYESGIAPCYGGRVYRVRKNNVYNRNRKLFNTLIAGGAGAVVGSLVDGKRGALIGAGAGAGGYLLYRYVRNRRTGRCERVYLRG